MRISIKAYEDHYHQNGKFIDNWQEGIKLLPFNSNPASAFDKGCGLNGSTGEFFRIWANDGTKEISDFNKSVITPIRSYLSEQRQMPFDQVDEFVRMLEDILYVNGNINITDSSFLKYLPLVPNDETISEKDRKKYRDGQRKIANFLFSMLSEDFLLKMDSDVTNLFTKILQEALSTVSAGAESERNREYFILPYIKQTFVEDLSWLLEQEEIVKVKYLPLLFHFYTCYAVTQAIVNITPKSKDTIQKPSPFYFILKSEKASIKHDAVVLGWSSQIPKSTLDKLFGKSQALDILNTVLGGEVGFYHDIYSRLEETPFEENKDACVALLRSYQAEKREVFSNRRSEDGSIDEIEIDISSYDDFVETLEHLCVGLQSPSYVSRMRKKVIDLLSARFLQSRRGNFVLVLDNEMLTFLIAMFCKGGKEKLENVYKHFNDYGIFFNRGTRNAIEAYLLKLNLLDRKSDSGEAQYVRVVL